MANHVCNTRASSRSRKQAERIRKSTYGTHNASVEPQVSSTRRRSGEAAGVGFSSKRKSRRAVHGYVDHLTPDASTRESDEAYSRRMNRREFTAEVQHKSRVRRVIVIIVIALLVLAAGAAAAYMAFFSSVNSKLALSDEKMSTVLAPEEAGKPYYVLLAADLTAIDGDDGLDALMLARVDAQERQATLIAIPYDVRLVYQGDFTTADILAATKGDSALVSAIASNYGVYISHFMRTTQAGFEHFVDTIGGVDVFVDQEVDDPAAGSAFLPIGQQVLDGPMACVYMKASNYSDGQNKQLQCQCDFAQLFAVRFLEQGNYELGLNLDDEAAYMRTDLDAHACMDVLESLRGMERVYAIYVDGYSGKVAVDGKMVPCYVNDENDLKAVMRLVEAGEDPAELRKKVEVDVDKESFEITVLNGSGVTGGASMISDILTNAGFQVAETGNADSYVYDETFIIYLDPSYKDEAEAVQQALGAGRVLNGANYYTFETEIEVILGSDWKPMS